MEKRIREYIKLWEGRCYPDGIPDEVPSEISDKVPSYKRICLAILRNDVALQSLGYQQPKSLVYNELKRIEIQNRNIMPVKKDERPALTDIEKGIIQGLEKHPDGILRGYTPALYRFLDDKFNPIANLGRTQINNLVFKGYLELLPDHKFKLL